MNHGPQAKPQQTTSFRGEVWTDARGLATVTLPAEARTLEPPLEYELRDIEPPTSARVTAGVLRGRFTIVTEQPFMKVAWRITGRSPDSQRPDPQDEEDAR